jgi:DNA invertase Pin-like site-specific DNA recombinase
MSTDLQKYSTENQLDTIRRYAEQRGFTIVRVFEDSGRSGLRMDGRDGLKSLMLEVQSDDKIRVISGPSAPNLRCPLFAT